MLHALHLASILWVVAVASALSNKACAKLKVKIDKCQTKTYRGKASIRKFGDPMSAQRVAACDSMSFSRIYKKKCPTAGGVANPGCSFGVARSFLSCTGQCSKQGGLFSPGDVANCQSVIQNICDQAASRAAMRLLEEEEQSLDVGGVDGFLLAQLDHEEQEEEEGNIITDQDRALQAAVAVAGNPVRSTYSCGTIDQQRSLLFAYSGQSFYTATAVSNIPLKAAVTDATTFINQAGAAFCGNSANAAGCNLLSCVGAGTSTSANPIISPAIITAKPCANLTSYDYLMSSILGKGTVTPWPTNDAGTFTGITADPTTGALLAMSFRGTVYPVGIDFSNSVLDLTFSVNGVSKLFRFPKACDNARPVNATTVDGWKAQVTGFWSPQASATNRCIFGVFTAGNILSTIVKLWAPVGTTLPAGAVATARAVLSLPSVRSQACAEGAVGV